MQRICRLGAGSRGRLLAPFNARARLVKRLCIEKQFHLYIMWLICFINIRRMFQFPPVNRISADLKLNHCEQNLTKDSKTRRFDLIFSAQTWFTVSVFLYFSSLFRSCNVAFSIAFPLPRKLCKKSLFIGSVLRSSDLSGLFPQIKIILTPLTLLNL